MSLLMDNPLGTLSALVAVVCYLPYLVDMARGKTRPHMFSWLIWSLVSVIVFAGQQTDNAGAGAWSTGVTSLLCTCIFLYSIVKGDRQVTTLDWICLLIGLCSIPLWALTDTALYSVLLMTVIDMVGFIPTFRKSWHRPHEETWITFALASLKYLLAVPAMSHYSLITTLYPVSVLFSNILFVVMILIRRRQVRDASAFSKN